VPLSTLHHPTLEIWCCASSQLLQLSGVLDSSDLKLGSVLLKHIRVVVFPELLGGVLACDALEDLGSTWVLVGKVYTGCQSGPQIMPMVPCAQASVAGEQWCSYATETGVWKGIPVTL
jgi:hypothetical protein